MNALCVFSSIADTARQIKIIADLPHRAFHVVTRCVLWYNRPVSGSYTYYIYDGVTFMAYDVFISFKNTAPGGGFTLDRTIAERLHIKLRDEGLEVFFSEKDLSTGAFMDQIYQALDEARVLILVGTSVEHINSEWVKSEWSTFFGSMKSGRKPDGHILTVLHGVSTRELPIQLEHFESFSANDLDSAVNFTFRTLGKVKRSEAAAWLAEEQERKRKAAEEAAILEAQKRLEAERQAEREKAAAEKKRQKALAAAERERQKRINAEKRAAEAQERSRKQAGQNKALKIAAAVLCAVLIWGGAFGVGAYVKQQKTIDEQQMELPKQSSEPLTKADRDLSEIFGFEWVGDGFSITSYNDRILHGSFGSEALPDMYNGYSVTAIGERAFAGKSVLSSVIIPDSVTDIGYSAFRGCRNLKSITIPDSVTSIRGCAFAYCENLTSIIIPDGVTIINDSTFAGCTKLNSIVIPDSVNNIDCRAFSYCISLTSINIPDNVTSIGDHAFYNCKHLTSISIPDSVISIGDNAFGGYNITVTAPHEASYYGYTPESRVTWVVE